MVKLSKEVMLEAKIGQKSGLLHQTLVKLWMQNKNDWKQLKLLLNEHMNDKKAKQAYW